MKHTKLKLTISAILLMSANIYAECDDNLVGVPVQQPAQAQQTQDRYVTSGDTSRAIIAYHLKQKIDHKKPVIVTEKAQVWTPDHQKAGYLIAGDVVQVNKDADLTAPLLSVTYKGRQYIIIPEKLNIPYPVRPERLLRGKTVSIITEYAGIYPNPKNANAKAGKKYLVYGDEVKVVDASHDNNKPFVKVDFKGKQYWVKQITLDSYNG